MFKQASTERNRILKKHDAENGVKSLIGGAKSLFGGVNSSKNNSNATDPKEFQPAQREA